jgi:glycogen debranching enzyme
MVMARQASQHSPHQQEDRKRQPAQQKRRRKHSGPTHDQLLQLESIAEAVVIKDEDVFFLCKGDGQVPLRSRHGFGLYYHDCRFLDGYELHLAGRQPAALTATSRQGFLALVELIGPTIRTANGAKVQNQDIGVRWERALDSGRLTLLDRITFHNYSLAAVEFPMTLLFRADFEDVFTVRGLLGEKRAARQTPQWQDGMLTFRYEGSDDIYRSVQVSFSPSPDHPEKNGARFQVRLPPGAGRQYEVALTLRESGHPAGVQPHPPASRQWHDLEQAAGRSSDQWRADQTRVTSDSPALEQIIERSLRDLRVLRSRLQGEEFFAGGVPWYVALFGRDSILAALQTLAYVPDVAEQTLRLLARYQGTKVDDWRDEQPGKILHELRVGELAHIGAIPHTPYYGSIDSTPLFLILLGRHAAWTGDLRVFHDLRDHVERALKWMRDYGDLDGDGYLEYESQSKKGLSNQGWKDSGDAIVNADGSLAQPPIKLVEVQGYAYRARLYVAELFERAGETERAAELRREARELRERFNRDFWLADEQFYALALQKDMQPAKVIASNAGQALWTGIVAADRAGALAKRLLADDMFSGWGVRTLSSRERRYNPIGYHLGTVWPHDNALIAAGFRDHGLDDAALKIFEGITRAAMHFPSYRLPEVFTGFSRRDFGVPVRYPVACHPQAWAAGAVPFMLERLLGLDPEAFDNRLHVVRPILPDDVTRLDLTGLRVGKSRLDLRFRRGPGRTEVEVLRREGPVEVKVEAALARNAQTS